jgi:transcriptional regulator with XRE-family HTH domain
VPPRKRPPPDLKPLGAVFRKFRESRHVSQEAFAHEHEFDRSVIGATERGERNIAFGTIRELLIANGKSWVDFGRAMQKRDLLPSSKAPRKRR